MMTGQPLSQSVQRERRCKDCDADSKRPAPYPGPRCHTHHKAAQKAQRLRNKERRVERVYGLTAAQYDDLKRRQGGRCAICRRAKGKTKRLAVDHDHNLAGSDSVRGLLCGPCNSVLAHFRSDPATALRAFWYLVSPPAQFTTHALPQPFPLKDESNGKSDITDRVGLFDL